MSIGLFCIAATSLIAFRHTLQARADLSAVQPVTQAAPEPPPALKATPRISVLTIAFAPDEDPGAIIDNFLRIDYPNKELVLGIGGAHRIDDYQQRATEEVVLIEHPGGWKNNLLGKAFKIATGEIIVFTDGDSRYVGDSFLRLVAPIVNGEEVATCGATRALPEFAEKWVVQMHQSRFTARREDRDQAWYVQALPGPNSAVRRDVLAQIDAFNTSVVADDNWRAFQLIRHGHRIRRVPDSVVEMIVPYTVRDYVRQQARWRRAWYMDSPRIGRRADTLLGLRSAAEGIAVLALTLLLPFTARARWIMLPVMTHLYLKRMRRILIATRRGRYRLRPLYFLHPIAVAYMDFAINIRALVEYIVPAWRKRW